jgi:hypothetical protein
MQLKHDPLEQLAVRPTIYTVTNDEIYQSHSIQLHNAFLDEDAWVTLRSDASQADASKNLWLSYDPTRPQDLVVFLQQVEIYQDHLSYDPKLRSWLPDSMLQIENLSEEHLKAQALRATEQAFQRVNFLLCRRHAKPITVKVRRLDFDKTLYDLSACCCKNFQTAVKQIIQEDLREEDEVV